MRFLLVVVIAGLVLLSGDRQAAHRQPVHEEQRSEAAAEPILIPAGPELPEPDLSVVPDLSIDPRFRIAVAATIRVDAIGGQLDEREVVAVLELAGWEGVALREAMLVAWCESRWSPWAVGDGGSSLGLFQLWSGWFSAFGIPLEMWSNPVANATVARLVLERRGRWGGGGGWSCAPSSASNGLP